MYFWTLVPLVAINIAKIGTAYVYIYNSRVILNDNNIIQTVFYN